MKVGVFGAVALLAVVAAIAGCGGTASSGPSFSFVCPAGTISKPALAEANTNPESRKATVPKGSDKLLLCLYRGEKPGSGPPIRRTEIWDPGQIRQTTIALNGLPATNEDMACFPGDGTIYAVFGYRDADPVVVELRLEGCWDPTNGHVEGKYAYVARPFAPILKFLRSGRGLS